MEIWRATAREEKTEAADLDDHRRVTLVADLFTRQAFSLDVWHRFGRLGQIDAEFCVETLDGTVVTGLAAFNLVQRVLELLGVLNVEDIVETLGQ